MHRSKQISDKISAASAVLDPPITNTNYVIDRLGKRKNEVCNT